MNNLNGVLIIPTGLGCTIGGDAAANPHVKLIASVCKNLIVNPNAVNASDINELPENALYVEGSTIDRLLSKKIGLRKVKTHNRILMVVNKPLAPANVNSKNAGIWGLGAEVEIEVLNKPLVMKASFEDDGTAGGYYLGAKELVEQVKDRQFDALAIQTPIKCDENLSEYYWRNGGVNPWGGIEAKVSHFISQKLNKPVAHAPIETVDGEGQTYLKQIVGVTMAPEIISNTYTFCILKGLHKSPQLVVPYPKNDFEDVLTNRNIDFLLTPHGCWGAPHEAAWKNGIPIIVVENNRTCFSDTFDYPYMDLGKRRIIFVKNYLEATGVIKGLESGVDITLLS